MAVTVALVTDKPAYQVGETITAHYDVTGADARTVTVSGTLTVDGQSVSVPPVDVTIAHKVGYAAPSAPGLTFTGSGGTFTATAS